MCWFGDEVFWLSDFSFSFSLRVAFHRNVSSYDEKVQEFHKTNKSIELFIELGVDRALGNREQ